MYIYIYIYIYIYKKSERKTANKQASDRGGRK